MICSSRSQTCHFDLLEPQERLPDSGFWGGFTTNQKGEIHPVSSHEELFAELAELLGIEFSYRDGTGEERSLSPELQVEFLESLGYGVSSVKQTLLTIKEVRESLWLAGIVPTRVLVPTEAEEAWHVYLPEGFVSRPYQMTWIVYQEDGHTRRAEVNPETIRIVERALVHRSRMARMELPPPPRVSLGYHRLHLVVKKGDKTERELVCRLIIAPETCYVPASLRDAVTRYWGLSADVYALRSEESWGAGDLRDLATLATQAGRAGAAVLALSPLHLIWNRNPASISPYYPVSRLYRNPLYLNVEAVPEFASATDVAAIMKTAAFESLRAGARETDLVDYDTVAALKGRVMRCLFETFMTGHYGSNDERDKAFKSFLRDQGHSLRETATFLALCDHFRKTRPSVWDWRDWQADFRRKNSPAVKNFARRHLWEIRFHEYVQWCLDDQLRDAAGAAGEAGMALGLLNDLAVGSDPAGADVWANQGLFAEGIEMGAPPDAFNMLGQAWGVPPLDPGRLRESGYDFFIQLIRSTMHHAGAIRIDHILGFFRSFWVLRGRTAVEGGAYVRYPAEDLLRILALESHRSQTLVVGEDLGVVTPEVHDAMERFHILSSRLLYFERLPDAGFPSPEEYPRLAWASVNTHDLPTLSGWWKGTDIDIKRDLSLFPEGADDPEGKMRWDRGVDRWRLLSRLHGEGILSDDVPREPDLIPELTEAVRDAALVFLERTPSVLVTVSIPDLLMMEEQQNVPGTLDEHPNWRRKISRSIDSKAFREGLDHLGRVFRNRGRAIVFGERTSGSGG